MFLILHRVGMTGDIVARGRGEEGGGGGWGIDLGPCSRLNLKYETLIKRQFISLDSQKSD